MKQSTAITSYSQLLEGKKLYIQRARIVLPILVRQALAKRPITYSDLAEEMGMLNSRNLNYVLGSVGNALIELAIKENHENQFPVSQEPIK